jgi:hypothetical protein
MSPIRSLLRACGTRTTVEGLHGSATHPMARLL